MKRQYLQSLPKATEIRNQAYLAYLATAQKLFSSIQQKYDKETCQFLLEQIKKLNDVRQIKKIHKKPIYEFFIKREISTLNYLKGTQHVDFQIMKLTKCKLEGFKIQWKSIWERILKQVPESSVSASKGLEIFLKHIKQFFDQNNAIQVWQYFQKLNYKSMDKLVTAFARVTPQTKQQIFNQFLNLLISKQKINQIKQTEFITLFFWLQKSRKRITLQKEVIQYVNDLVLQFILANRETGSKRTSFENNFHSFTAQILQKVLGKANPDSLKLLQIIFSYIKKFIKPLENSTKSVMFIHWLFKSLFLRVQIEKKTREKLQKLIQKMEKKQPSEQQGQPQTKAQQLQQKKQQEDKDKKQQKQQKPQTKQKQENQQNDQQDEDVLQQDEQNQGDELPQMLNGQSKISFQKDDEKPDTDQQKKQKMEKMLANEITQQILNYLQKQVEQIFQILYFVNSKKTISYLLRYIYRLFPKFVLKSLDVINKAANIPNINEDGLTKNLITTVQHMFMDQNYTDGVKNVMRVLERAYNSRRIVDVWRIYQSIGSKIPLLQQKDLQQIQDSDKDQFEKTFGLNHDRFYTEYSDHMVQAFKRLLKQGQFIEKNQYKAYSTTMQQTFFNSYPHMRKRILTQAMQIVQQNPNFLVLLYFHYSQLPQKQFKILKTQFLSINDQNRDTLQLRLQFLSTLSKKMTLDQLKPYIRKYAQKGEFHLIQQYANHRLSEQISWKPFKTTLNYLYEDPKITIQFKNSPQQIKICLKQLSSYRDELIDQASKQIDKIIQDQPDSISQRIIKSYTTPAKISTLVQRKKIHEILALINYANLFMEQKILTIKNNKKLQLIDSQVRPYGFLDVNKPFSKYIKKILNSQQVLHDPKLISALNTLLTNEYFMYFDIEMNCDKLLEKQRKRNKNHEATGCVNLAIYGSQYLASAKGYMAHFLHKANGGSNHDIKGKIGELFLLSMINSNESYKDIRSMFQQARLIDVYRQYLIDLMSLKVQNRELIKRISSTIDFLTKKQVSYLNYTDEQILEFVSYHATLMQSFDSKIKQNAIKSFRKFNKIIQDNPISDKLTEAMLKYRNSQKMQLIWMIYVAALVNNPQFQQDQNAEKRILYILKNIQGLLLHETRSTRRISVYLYPSLIRVLKKINKTYEIVSYSTEKYETKSLEQFIQKGYLKNEFYDKDLKDKSTQRKHPHQSYKIKKQYKIPQNLFDFLINNPQNSMKFIKSFHSDLASTAQMMISAMQAAANNVDLFSIASKGIQRLIYFFKTKDMAISRSQMFVGAKFFKYLCIQDAHVGYKFHQIVKEFVLSCLSNMQSLDNQTLVILYSFSLLNSYQATFTKRIPHIQQFLTKVFKEVINKSSKAIFSKLQLLFFKKIKNREAIKFIIQFCEKMIEENKKIYRAGYLLGLVNGKAYQTSEKLLKKMFDQKLQIEHENNVATVFNFILSYPQISIWNFEQIQKTEILNLKQLKEQKRIQQIQGKYIIFSNKKIQQYLVKSIKQMIGGQSVEMAKTGFTILNNTLKSCANLYLSEANTDFIVDILNLQLQMLVTKKQLQLDFQLGNKAIGYLLTSEMLPSSAFQKFLTTILERSEPTKKFCGLFTQILNSPINFIKLSSATAEKFALKILDFEPNSAIYKYLLKILSTLLIYRIDIFQKLIGKEIQNKNRRVLLLQAYLMAQNSKLNQQYVKQVLKGSQKDRRNLWARQMLLVRGQRQFFDDQQTYQIWRQIKQLSNPYFYHA